jgi:hypothetical protein
MQKVKITNLKQGAVVINSLNMTLGGGVSIVRDASFMDDPDIEELRKCGIIKVSSYDSDIQTQQQTIVAPTEQKMGDGKKTKKKSPKSSPVNVKITKKQNQAKPGTSFKIPEGPEDAMESRVVIIGESGPEEKKMGPGINGIDIKFVGDEDQKEQDASNGFITID